MDVTFSPALRVYAEMWEIAGRRRAADAQFSQALTHIRSGTPDAMAKAFDLFKRSGAHNFTEAQFAAGWCCEHGCGTKRNYPQAIRWYKRAENNVTSDVMSAFDPVGEAENARIRLYFECESYAAAVDALLDAQEREDSFMADYEAAVGGDAIGMLHLGHRYYYGRMWRVTRQRASAGITGPPRLAAMPPCRSWHRSTRRTSTTRRRQGGIAAMRRSESAGATSG